MDRISNMMSHGHILWSGFLAGLASPTGLFAEPAPYYYYLNNLSVPQNFAVIGSLLSSAYASEVVKMEDAYSDATKSSGDAADSAIRTNTAG